MGRSIHPPLVGPSPRRSGACFVSDRRGTTIVEFALIAPVLFLLLFGTIELGIVFAANVFLKNATYSASRTGRTGFVEANGTQDATIRAKLRYQAGVLMDPSKLVITSKSYTGFDGLGKPEPFVDANGNGRRDDGENFTDVNGNSRYDLDRGADSYGGTSQVVLYTATYPWRFVTPLVGNILSPGGGPFMLTATAVVQNEPY